MLIRSMQAAGIVAGVVQDMFARKPGEGEGVEEDTTGGYFNRKFCRSG